MSIHVHHLPHIDLLDLQSRLKYQNDAQGLTYLYDPIRRKYIRATPEEVVRQLWIIYLIEILSLNPKLIAVERSFTFNGMKRRFDLVVFENNTVPKLLAEFKAPGVKIHQEAFDQIARYNMQLQVPYALISNGSRHYCFRIDDVQKGFIFLQELPLGTHQ